MKAFTSPLLELAEFEEIQKKCLKKTGMTLLTGCVTSQKTHMIYALSDGCKRTVIVLSDEEKAKKMYEEYRFLQDNVCYYPAKGFSELNGGILPPKTRFMAFISAMSFI